ncbi:alpha/beta hydrolase, partial [Helicosporidium sp. ATCC 50920]
MLFLHGFPESWSAWSAQIAHFREDYDVVAMDMRGYGQSDKPRGFRSYCYRHLVNDVAAVVRAISPKRPVYLVAHDWGANVAWMFAHRHADMIKKLVILCVPHPRCFLKNADLAQMRRSWYVFAFQMPFVGEAMFSVNNYKAVGDMFLGRASGLVNRENFSREDLARKKQEIATPGARTGMLNYYRALAYPDLEFDRAGSRTVDCPTLMMYADRDVALGTKLFRGHERLVPGIKTHCLQNCSHWAMQD